MAKFLFIYFHSREGVVREGKPKGGSVVQTLVWMKALHELGHDVYQATYENDQRELSVQYNWIKPVHLYHPEKFKRTFVKS